MNGNNKKRKIESDASRAIEGCGSMSDPVDDRADSQGIDTESPYAPLPFTCLCYNGLFYTTDNCGYFIHFLHGDGTGNVAELMVCEVHEDTKETRFRHIRALNEEESAALEHVDCLNVVNDLTKNNKSLLF